MKKPPCFLAAVTRILTGAILLRLFARCQLESNLWGDYLGSRKVPESGAGNQKSMGVHNFRSVWNPESVGVQSLFLNAGEKVRFYRHRRRTICCGEMKQFDGAEPAQCLGKQLH